MAAADAEVAPVEPVSAMRLCAFPIHGNCDFNSKAEHNQGEEVNKQEDLKGSQANVKVQLKQALRGFSEP